MPRQPTRRIWAYLCTIILTAGANLVGCGRLVASPPPPPALHLDNITANAVAVCAQLSAASLFHVPAPPRLVQPVLRDLITGGWDAKSKLNLDIRYLTTRMVSRQRVNCYELRYTSHYWRGQPVRIFGYLGCPAVQGRKPALLLIHGGGGYATLDRVLEAAGKGYVALAIDLPGRGTQRERFSRSTGPDMTVAQLFTVRPTLSDNYIYNAVLAQMRAISVLSSLRDVDGTRIGLVGVSWGGATGLITTSLDKRIRCFVDIFGAGFLRGGSTWHDYLDRLDPRDVQTWEDNFDASRYLTDINVPVFGITGTNDNCYYLPRFIRTLSAIKPTPDLLLLPNLDHRTNNTARRAWYQWLDEHLKGKLPRSRPRLAGMRVVATSRGARVYIRAAGQADVRRVEVWYSPVHDTGWTDRKWRRTRCQLDATKSWFAGEIPLTPQITYTFGCVYFADGTAYSTPVHSLANLTLNGRTVALDMPFVTTEPLKIEAHYLASLTGALVRPLANDRVLLARATVRAELPALRLADLYYVTLRDAVQRLGGTVDWTKGRTIITIPIKDTA